MSMGKIFLRREKISEARQPEPGAFRNPAATVALFTFFGADAVFGMVFEGR